MGMLETLSKPLPGEEGGDIPDDSKSKKVRAMKRLRMAFKSGDDEAAAEAFADAFAACEMYEADESEEE